jgi:Ca-activated chloride channel family protein
MKNLLWFLLLQLLLNPLCSQYYLRGEIKDERGRVLEGVKIILSSLHQYPFYSGNDGTFGISTSKSTDSITLSMDGYENLKLWVDVKKFQSLLMKMLPATRQLYSKKLASSTTHLKNNIPISFSVIGESYSDQIENPFIEADTYPETGFSMNIDKASYSNVRRFIQNGMKVPTDAVRIEEMLNHFTFTNEKASTSEKEFSCASIVTDCPWQKKNKLLFINLAAPKINLDSIPASNLVFLIDVSGSMDKPNRLPLLQSAFKLLIENLRKQDTISLITYGGGVNIVLSAIGGNEKKKINDAIDSLSANGDTPGEGAIRIAYDLAKKTFLDKGNNRVILATDGDFNVGQYSEKELEDLIIRFRNTGIYLTCLGVGMGNYKDSKLETLAKKGNGNFAYLDNLQEAQKILVTEFTETLYSVADNAFIKIKFNPEMVAQYRLIGFDNKRNAIADSTSELEGGEIGSGHSMMAIFEIQPTDPDSLYHHHSIAQTQLFFKHTATQKVSTQFFNTDYEPILFRNADSGYQFATAVALFGAILKKSVFINHFQFEDMIGIAKNAINMNDFSQKEFISLIEKAIHIYSPMKRKK